MDFTRPERCQRQRTGQEDRRSKFYEIPDNLAMLADDDNHLVVFAHRRLADLTAELIGEAARAPIVPVPAWPSWVGAYAAEHADCRGIIVIDAQPDAAAAIGAVINCYATEQRTVAVETPA